MPNRDIPMEELAAAMPLARAYCEPECQTRVMDTDLVYASARVLIREGWIPPEAAMAEARDVSNPIPPSMRGEISTDGTARTAEADPETR